MQVEKCKRELKKEQHDKEKGSECRDAGVGAHASEVVARAEADRQVRDKTDTRDRKGRYKTETRLIQG